MEIRVLRYFLAVVREESITKAAESLHVTQPTLSRQLAQLEEQVGARLFARGARKITLTAEGRLLRRRAEDILELVDKTEGELASYGGELEGTVSIGCGDLRAVDTLVGLINAFGKRYPVVKFDLYTATAEHVKERMDSGAADIGLLLEPVSMEKYELIRLPERERWVAAMPPDSPLAAFESVTAEQLCAQPLVLPQRIEAQSALAHWFGERFRTLDVRCTSNLPSTALAIVRTGAACALIIGGSVTGCDPAKVTYRPLKPELTAESVIAWRRAQPFGAAAERFIEFLRESLDARQPE